MTDYGPMPELCEVPVDDTMLREKALAIALSYYPDDGEKALEFARRLHEFLAETPAARGHAIRQASRPEQPEESATAVAADSAPPQTPNPQPTPEPAPESAGGYARERKRATALPPAALGGLTAPAAKVFAALCALIPDDRPLPVRNVAIAHETDVREQKLPGALAELEYKGYIERAGRTSDRTIRILKRPEGRSANEGGVIEATEPTDVPSANEPSEVDAANDSAAPPPEPAPQRAAPTARAGFDARAVPTRWDDTPVPRDPTVVFPDTPRPPPVEMGPAIVSETTLTDGEARLLKAMLERPDLRPWDIALIGREFGCEPSDVSYWRKQLVDKGYVESCGRFPVGRKYRPVRDLKGNPLEEMVE